MPHGEFDDYYLSYSGGHGSNVRVAGIPSMRHIRTIAVFAPNAPYGYSYDDDTREMLGEYTWGNVHHPALSQTEGEYDGRWLFVNDNAHNRVARISLHDFETTQILGPIPNTSGNHGCVLSRPTPYISSAAATSPCRSPRAIRAAAAVRRGLSRCHHRHQCASRDGRDGGGLADSDAALPVGPSSAGKGPGEDWFFVSSYNTDLAHRNFEVGASQLERDMAAYVNWRRAEEALEAGNFEEVDGVPVIDPSQVDGMMYDVPLAKSSRGIDVSPNGRWIVGSGKLEPSVTMFDFEQFVEAVDHENFIEQKRGVKVVDPDAVVEGMVPVGMGPLHTQFERDGHGYTTLFIDSKVAKFKLRPWTEQEKQDLAQFVLDRINVHTNPGHRVIGGSDTVDPYGQ